MKQIEVHWDISLAKTNKGQFKLILWLALWMGIASIYPMNLWLMAAMSTGVLWLNISSTKEILMYVREKATQLAMDTLQILFNEKVENQEKE